MSGDDNMAYVRARGKDVWEITVYTGSHVENGRRVRHRYVELFHGSKAAARERAAELELRLRGAERQKDLTKLTFGEAAGEWLRAIQPRLRPRTYDRYEEILRLYALPRWSTVPLVRLEARDIEAAYGELPPAKAAKLHAVLRPMLKYCYRKRWIPSNPMDFVETPKWAPRERDPIPEAHVAKILQAFRGTRWYALVALALHTGMRLGELLGLRWGDVDWKNGVLWVRRQLVKPGRHPEFAAPKTVQSEAPVPLDRHALAILRWHRWRQSKERPMWREDHDLIFTATDGSPVHDNNWRRRVWYETLKTLGLPRYVPHQLRHTTATELLGGKDAAAVAAVSRRLRHARITTTLDMYTAAISDDEWRAAKKAGRLIWELSRPKRDRHDRHGKLDTGGDSRNGAGLPGNTSVAMAGLDGTGKE